MADGVNRLSMLDAKLEAQRLSSKVLNYLRNLNIKQYSINSPGSS